MCHMPLPVGNRNLFISAYRLSAIVSLNKAISHHWSLQWTALAVKIGAHRSQCDGNKGRSYSKPSRLLQLQDKFMTLLITCLCHAYCPIKKSIQVRNSHYLCDFLKVFSFFSITIPSCCTWFLFFLLSHFPPSFLIKCLSIFWRKDFLSLSLSLLPPSSFLSFLPLWWHPISSNCSPTSKSDHTLLLPWWIQGFLF